MSGRVIKRLAVLALMLSGADSAAARPPATERMKQELAATIAELARERLLLPEALVSVDALELPDGATRWLELGASEIASKGRPSGWITARTRVVTRTGEESVWLKAHVLVLVPTVVTARALARGALIDRDDLRVEPRPLGDDQVMTRPELAEGSIVRVALAAGEPLSLRQLERPTLIKRGASVLALVGDRRFALKAPAEALESGALGDEIALRVVLGRKVVKGIVRSADTVEVL